MPTTNRHKVTVGYLNLVNAQLVTKHLGLIAKEMPGVEIKYVKVGGGGDMLRAIAGNDVDFGGLGNPPTAIGITRNLPIKGIMVINMLDYVEAMVVRTSKNIKSFKDLKGKTVAAPFGSTTHYLLMQALKDDDVDPSLDEDFRSGVRPTSPPPGRAAISTPPGSGSPISTRRSKTAVTSS